MHASHGALGVRERLVGIDSLLHLCGFLGLNSGPGVRQQAPLSAALKCLLPA